MSTAITSKTENPTGLSIDLNNTELPNLQQAQALPLSLGGDYWTPLAIGETKRVFFFEIKPTTLMDFNNKELIELDCAYFLEQDDQLQTHTIYNGSRVLVGIIESCIASGIIQKGTPLEIKYEGKKKNKSNGNQSDRWNIKPLIVNI